MKTEEITTAVVIEAFERLMQAAAAEGRRLALIKPPMPAVRSDQFIEMRRCITDGLNAFQHALVTIGTDKCTASYHQLKQITRDIAAKKHAEDDA